MLNDFIKSFCPQGENYHVHEEETPFKIAQNLSAFASAAAAANQPLVLVCIGSDRSTGDCLGPLTGTKLTTLLPQIPVFGTLDEPVHATNLVEKLDYIHQSFPNPFLIAIDACLGKLDHVGSISLGRGSLKPGTALRKDLPAVGDAYITGIVNVGGFMEQLVLQSTRLNLVVKMAETISYGIFLALLPNTKVTMTATHVEALPKS
ncbi:MAG: spore protease YyaC [Sporomusaceae bacterium]|nr:spore protease YyaC [Sporomusaceae bacterium]